MEKLKPLDFCNCLLQSVPKHFFFTGISLLIFANVFAQKNEKMAIANDKFEQFSFIDAREIYLDELEKGHKSAVLLKRLGDSYYFNNEYQNAMEWYSELIIKYPGDEYEVDYLFRYAQTLKSINMYDEAEEIMQTFYYRKGIQKEDQEEKEEGLYKKQNRFIQLVPFSYNSRFSDYAPQFGKEGQLLFTSARDSLSSIHEWNKEPFLDIYLLENRKVSKVKGKINTKFHESSATFSPSKDTIYFTRTNMINNAEGRKKGKKAGHLSIYRAYVEYVGQYVYNRIEELSINSNNYSVGHPAISPDGKKMVFASDMNGGFGSTDLYMADITSKGKLKNIRNLGSQINTFGRETFPSFDKKGNLYFSSDGHEGLGGLDIFLWRYPLFENGELFNLGKPINSEADDFSFIYDSNSKKGYFSSNREGGMGGDDIYAFEKTSIPVDNCVDHISIEGKVFNGKKFDPIQQTRVSLLDANGNVIEEQVLIQNYYKFTVACGKSVSIQIRKQGYTTKEIFFAKEAMGNYSAIEQNIFLLKGTSVQQVNFVENNSLKERLSPNPLYFGLNSTELRKEAKLELNSIIAYLTEHSQTKILVNAYTDKRGSTLYNKKLSIKRAEAIKRYMVRNGILYHRILTKGYGENNLAVHCLDGCDEKVHQVNRRCEFILF